MIETADHPLKKKRELSQSAPPLTRAQESLYFLNQLTNGLPVYHMPQAFRVRGPLNLNALERALRAVVERHDALRMRIREMPEGAVQEPASADDFCLRTHHLADLTLTEIQESIKQPFDLARDLPFRAELYRLASDDHVLLIVLHHLVGDMSSLAILYRELSELYAAFCAGHEASLAPVELQFGDYAREQRSEEVSDETKEFWRERLKDCTDELEIALDRSRPRLPSFKGEAFYFELNPEFASRISAVARQNRCSPYMLYLAALQVLLYRYTGQERFAIGTPFTQREDERLENTAGYLINLLPIPCELRPRESFAELLARVRATALEIYGHHEISFREILGELCIGTESPKPALARVVFQYFPELPALSLNDLECSQIKVHSGTSKFDLCFSAFERNGAVTTEIEYDTDIFDGATIERLGGHWKQLLRNIVANQDQEVSALEFMPESELRLIESWNNTQTDYPRNATVHELFEEQVRLHPEKTALLFGDEQIRYSELNERAEQIAQQLQADGVKPGDFVGVCLDRSPDLIASLIGILKAGAAFVPFDANYPKPRLDYLFADSGVRLLVTDSGRAQIAPAGVKTVFIDRVHGQPRSCSSRGNETHFSVPDAEESESRHLDCSDKEKAQAPAYMMYTSGSTGNPKGAVIPHRAIVRLVKETNFASFSPEEIFLLFAPISFDASTLEIWGPLLNGATLAIFPPRFESLEQFEEVLQKSKVTTLWLTAGLFNTIVDRKAEALRGVRQLLVGGDTLSVAHIRKAQEALPHATLINGYGPTENTTFTCCYTIPRNWLADRPIPIGRPICNTRVYILDEKLQRVPIGVPGDLYAAGDGLSLGYWNQPELTARAFVPDPFDDAGKTKMYKTGDRARFLPDGAIEFLGRRDCQVKIRGFRIELGEIENAFRAQGAVRDVAVIPVADHSGGKILVAYVTAKPGAPVDPHELLQPIAAVLPSHACPSRVVLLDELPLGPNGKVNRAALPALNLEGETQTLEGAAATNPVEEKLLEIWRQILELPRAGIDDNFFKSGGESLRATRAISQINAAFHCRLTLPRLFEAPTVRQMAHILERALHDGSNAPLTRNAPRPADPPNVTDLSDEEVDTLLNQLLSTHDSES